MKGLPKPFQAEGEELSCCCTKVVRTDGRACLCLTRTACLPGLITLLLLTIYFSRMVTLI